MNIILNELRDIDKRLKRIEVIITLLAEFLNIEVENESSNIQGKTK